MGSKTRVASPRQLYAGALRYRFDIKEVMPFKDARSSHNRISRCSGETRKNSRHNMNLTDPAEPECGVTIKEAEQQRRSRR